MNDERGTEKKIHSGEKKTKKLKNRIFQSSFNTCPLVFTLSMVFRI